MQDKKNKTSIFASSFHPPSLCRFFLGVVSATLVHVFCTWATEATPAVRIIQEKVR